MRLFFLFIALLTPLPALAGMAEAKDFAKQQGCKIQNVIETNRDTGTNGYTTYKVACEVAAGASEDEKKANDTLVLRCYGTLCTLLKKGG